PGSAPSPDRIPVALPDPDATSDAGIADYTSDQPHLVNQLPVLPPHLDSLPTRRSSDLQEEDAAEDGARDDYGPSQGNHESKDAHDEQGAEHEPAARETVIKRLQGTLKLWSEGPWNEVLSFALTLKAGLVHLEVLPFPVP